MVFDMTDPYCTLILRGIENTLYQASYLPILTDVHNERSRFERYLEMLLDRRVEALDRARELAVRRHRRARRSGEEQHSHGDDWARIEDRVDQLGDRRQRDWSIPRLSICTRWVIARLLSFAARRRWAIARRAGRAFATLRSASGLELDQRLIVDLPESRDPISSFEAGYKLTEELIHAETPFTALMAFDDMTAFGAIRALAKAGLARARAVFGDRLR